MHADYSHGLALIAAGVMPMLSAPAMAQYEPVLTLEGTCPGVLRAEVSGAAPRRGVFLLFASETGSYQLPPHSQFCAGVVLGLGTRNLHQAAAGTTDKFGFISFERSVSQRACGGYLQALTYPQGGCLASNVVQIE